MEYKYIDPDDAKDRLYVLDRYFILPTGSVQLYLSNASGHYLLTSTPDGLSQESKFLDIFLNKEIEIWVEKISNFMYMGVVSSNEDDWDNLVRMGQVLPEEVYNEEKDTATVHDNSPI